MSEKLLPASVHRIENIQRAWRWIRSNPDAGYKGYFRDHYSAFAIAQDVLLRDLSDRLRRGAYQPGRACKIFLPKASGVLRPYTLLDVEDQIAYQAAANVVAERMCPHVRHRYFKQVFGHLYAGKTSTWFYRKWASGYSAFNKAAVSAYENGQVFTASFDLTAFYDSIDHRVLAYFLDKFGVDRDSIDALTDWLSMWTGTDAQILQGHGIPQGPLGSGLIAEAVLSHLDDHGWHGSGVTYLRYVDDIRLFAKTEHALRAALIRLDHLSKDIGLFPQSAKIGIHSVVDIFAELKSVSEPIESVVSSAKVVDQKKLSKRLMELSPRHDVKDRTRFKYLLAHAIPSAKLTSRLWEILNKSPDLYESVARYLARSNKLPRATSREVVRRIVGEKLYPAIAASFLRGTRGRLHSSEMVSARAKFKRLWHSGQGNAEFAVALGQWLISEGVLTDRRITYACARARAAWVRSSLILAVDTWVTSTGVRSSVARSAILDRSADPAICGALIAGKDGLKPSVGARSMTRQAGLVLKEFGLIRRATGRVCGINATLRQLLSFGLDVPWQKFFGPLYRQAERQIVGCRGYASTDATAWVQGLDVFNDLLLDSLFRLDGGLGGYTLGNIGACTHSPSKAFSAKFPFVLDFAQKVHENRYRSYLAHPKVGKTKRATSRIPFRFIRESKQLMVLAIREISACGLV